MMDCPLLNEDAYPEVHTPVPRGWVLHVHPRGWVYFFNPCFKVLTTQDIRKHEVWKKVEAACSTYPLDSLGEGMEVQLTTSSQFQVLMVNHTQCIACYDAVDAQKSNFSKPYELNLNRRRYWNYLWNYPCHVPTPRSSCSRCDRRIDLVLLPCSTDSVSKTTFLAWLLREVCSYRNAETYGKYTRDKFEDLVAARAPKPRPQPQRSAIVNAFIYVVTHILFFGIPNIYYVYVKKTGEYRGRLSNLQENWQTFFQRLTQEYSNFLLVSTVLLSATIGFLAVPGISEGAKLAAIISTLTSLSSIIVGVFCIWRHQAKNNMTDLFTYMYNAEHSLFGYHGHALLLSIPPALLIWAILTFILSIVIYAMCNLAEAPWRDASELFILAILVILLVTVIAALYTFSILWEFQNRWSNLWYYVQSFIRIKPPRDSVR